MLDKEINELERKITQYERSIKNGNDNIEFKTIIIAAIITVITLLSVALGAAMSHPILVGIIGFSAASFVGIKIYEDGIKPSKDYIEGVKKKKKECEDLLKKYQNEKSMTKELKNDKKNDYSYKRDNSRLTDRDMDDMIDMFNQLNQKNHKNRK